MQGLFELLLVLLRHGAPFFVAAAMLQFLVLAGIRRPRLVPARAAAVCATSLVLAIGVAGGIWMLLGRLPAVLVLMIPGEDYPGLLNLLVTPPTTAAILACAATFPALTWHQYVARRDRE